MNPFGITKTTLKASQSDSEAAKYLYKVEVKPFPNADWKALQEFEFEHEAYSRINRAGCPFSSYRVVRVVIG